MRKILRRREVVEDEWRYLEELPETLSSVAVAASAPGAAQSALIIPVAQLSSAADTWHAWPGRLGVRVEAAARVEELASVLTRLELVAFAFPNAGDGRGYTYARLLRERYGFTGEVRATGAVKCDQIFFMARSGFDSFELAPGEDFDQALHALSRFSVAYAPGVAHLSILAQRFHAQRSGRTSSSNS
jgi:uncharacterized protein (DUF934 family)